MNCFEALADGTRRKIVELLMTGERASGEVAAHFSVSAPAISQHLKILREANLVRVRTDAQRRIYTLEREGFDELEAWVNRSRRFWSTRLDELEKAVRTGRTDDPAADARPERRKRS